jgi:hypothetical protein
MHLKGERSDWAVSNSAHLRKEVTPSVSL